MANFLVIFIKRVLKSPFTLLMFILKFFHESIAQRYIFAIMGLIALAITEGMRNVMWRTIITMPANFTRENVYYHDPENIIMPSFYWFYILAHLPAGMFGGKYTISLAMLSIGLLTLLIPIFMEKDNSTNLTFIFALTGLRQGLILPSLNNMLSQWTPTNERTNIGSIVYSGGSIGLAFTNFMLEKKFKFSVLSDYFILFGILGVVWFAVWSIFCYNTPEEHPFISEYEKNYLKESLNDICKEPQPVPWKRMLTSKALWALVGVHIGYDWILCTFDTYLPWYLNNVLHMKYNGYVPYVGMWNFSSTMWWISRSLVERKAMSITNTRKLVTTITFAFPVIFIVLMAYSTYNTKKVVLIFFLAFSFLGCGFFSLKVNTLDLSPNYSGIVMAICNGIAVLSRVLMPYIKNPVTHDIPPEEWNNAFSRFFWVTSGVVIVSNVFYLMFASGETQDWNRPSDCEKNVIIKKNIVKTEGNDVSKCDLYLTIPDEYKLS